jgi:hypothetical protein
MMGRGAFKQTTSTPPARGAFAQPELAPDMEAPAAGAPLMAPGQSIAAGQPITKPPVVKPYKGKGGDKANIGTPPKPNTSVRKGGRPIARPAGPKYVG